MRGNRNLSDILKEQKQTWQVIDERAKALAADAFSQLLKGNIYETYFYFTPATATEWGKTWIAPDSEDGQLAHPEPFRGHMTQEQMRLRILETMRRLPILPHA